MLNINEQWIKENSNVIYQLQSHIQLELCQKVFDSKTIMCKCNLLWRILTNVSWEGVLLRFEPVFKMCSLCGPDQIYNLVPSSLLC